MIEITLGDATDIDPITDDLGRDRIGFAATMSPLALYDAAHGSWVLGKRADSERFAIFTHAGVVRQAVEIERIEQVTNRSMNDPRDDRSVIHGRILEPGHPVFDSLVNRPSPVEPHRNPVRYFDHEFDNAERPCRCNCGGYVSGKEFLPGHDQTALHDRVRQIGSVAEFLDWFDVVRRGAT